MANDTHQPVRHYFAKGNTARGSVSLLDASLQHLQHVYILKGGPGTGKSTVIRTVCERLTNAGYEIWQLHCARDNDALDGVIVPRLDVAVVDGSSPHPIEPNLPGIDGTIVDLSEALNVARLRSYRTEIEQMHARVKQLYDQAYAGFAEALRVHDEWEAIYIDNMNFAAADQLTDELIRKLINQDSAEGTRRIDHRFLGAATPAGAVDFVPNLTDGLAKRYMIKGRPGSGKSTMLKKLASAASERGFDVEVFHCGFDPHSLDMVLVRELGFAIFDSTEPHEYYPERDGDTIIDMYEACIHPGTDERYAEQVEHIRAAYKAAMKKSIALLAEANTMHRKIEVRYTQSTDFRIIEKRTAHIIEEILRLRD